MSQEASITAGDAFAWHGNSGMQAEAEKKLPFEDGNSPPFHRSSSFLLSGRAAESLRESEASSLRTGRMRSHDLAEAKGTMAAPYPLARAGGRILNGRGAPTAARDAASRTKVGQKQEESEGQAEQQ